MLPSDGKDGGASPMLGSHWNFLVFTLIHPYQSDIRGMQSSVDKTRYCPQTTGKACRLSSLKTFLQLTEKQLCYGEVRRNRGG
jgi:hypothetical protein